MSEPTAHKRLTEEDLKESGWTTLPDRTGRPIRWLHWQVPGGLPLTFEAARRAEETRRKADRG